MQASTPLTGIPFELLLEILDCIPFFSLLSLRGVSKFFLRLITPQAFSTVSIRLLEDNAHTQLLLIKSISTPYSTIDSFIKTLRINPSPIISFDEEWINYFQEELPQDDMLVLVEHLALYLSKLQNLETVYWTSPPDQIDPALYFSSIAFSLSSLPKLENVAISISGGYINRWQDQFPPLRVFRNLSSISVDCSNCIYGVPTTYWNEVASAIKASPRLIRLSLGGDSPENGRKTLTSLQRLLVGAFPRLVLLDLHNVPLPAAGIKQTISSKLRNLSLSTLPGSRGMNFAWGKLWSALEGNRVELSTLYVHGSENAMDEMFAYLRSYTGLKKLDVRVQMDRRDMEDDAGHRFWRQIVPHHKDSLTDLTVLPRYEGVWCYGPSAATAILQCSSLQILTLSLCKVNPSWAEKKLSKAREDKKIDFQRLEEPCGEPENCAALILCDLVNPLAKLMFVLANNAPTYTENIFLNSDSDCENYVDGTYQIMYRKRNFLGRIVDVLNGMQGPAVASKNWPSIVLTSAWPLPRNIESLVKCRIRYDGSRWRVQKKTPIPEQQDEAISYTYRGINIYRSSDEESSE